MNQKAQVELPLDRIDEALISCAIPGFWGELCVDVTVLPTAALEVEFHCVRKTITQTSIVKSDVAIVPSNERVNKTRAKLSEYRDKLRLECPVAQIRALFRDGHLVTFEIAEASVMRAGI